MHEYDLFCYNYRMGKTVIQSKSAEQTKTIGREYAKQVRDGGLLLLYGDLGAGKTTFTQGFAEGLGIKRHINSPTFLLMRTYEIPKNLDGKFYHLDLYRLDNGEGVDDLGIDEILQNPKNVVVVEWADRLNGRLPVSGIKLYFEYQNNDQRTLLEK